MIHSARETEPAPRILSQKKDLGLIASCPKGCLHLTIGNTSIRLSEKQYWDLVDMLTESAALAAQDRSRADRVH